MRNKTSSAVKSLPVKDAAFVQPMECLAVPKLPNGSEWIYEVKLDGYRAIGLKTAQGKVKLFSRRGNPLNRNFPAVAEALDALPDATVIDGEVVALDSDGLPNFGLLTRSGKSASHIWFYVFDLLCFKNRDVRSLALLERRDLLKSIPLIPPIKLLEYFQTSADDMLDVVRQHSLEGVVAKRTDSPYESGRRTGAWIKHRVNQEQDFLIGGYMPGPHGVDSIIVGYYDRSELMYVGRVRAGLVPASRRELFQKLRPFVIEVCPFANLPEQGRSRWAESLTAEKMKQCVWVKPKIAAQIAFLEWTEGQKLRHSRFVRLKD